MTPFDYSYHSAYFWQIHENQEPSLTLKIRSTQRGWWDQRLLQNQEWLVFKNQDIICSKSSAINWQTSVREKTEKPPIFLPVCFCLPDILSVLCGLSIILLLSCSLFLKFIEDEAAPSWLGYFYAFSMFLLGCLQTLFEQRYMYMCLVLGLRLRTAVTGLVYRKVRLQLLF